ncbi:MAG: Holliday junction branch migration protein RuvA [Gammaproteobacteria bacterium]|nr:Holliday junction branch migration protein RuvA [Gammaproteobacteria bacterium]MBU6509903.1 Holliday junction branch migration protein RuvA [Gammaproteobacteria bacterium]MDE1983292.1 Holliday junction branch migration protein RuvA [Gammaproteobacteria bacterium]MDE2107855.1 Holliday junction branch migration protein RuvA [Gammaproteobacteria bacterium]MDE2460694.1 Holliday junction branch migration protein RuvA [Gammaproteobacteria bacterium]
MIGFLRGRILQRQPPHLLIDVQGVGYEVEAPMSTFYGLPEVGAEVMLYTHLAVREDAHVLFGFGTETERRLFRALIRVNGVGPRLALTILSGVSVDNFVRCVRNNDSAALTRLPGIGKKTAERLVVEMRDRLEQAGSEAVAGMVPMNARDEAMSALVSLGYKPPEASRMLQAIKDTDISSAELIRRALQNAARAG